MVHEQPSVEGGDGLLVGHEEAGVGDRIVQDRHWPGGGVSNGDDAGEINGHCRVEADSLRHSIGIEDAEVVAARAERGQSGKVYRQTSREGIDRQHLVEGRLAGEVATAEVKPCGEGNVGGIVKANGEVGRADGDINEVKGEGIGEHVALGGVRNVPLGQGEIVAVYGDYDADGI